MSARPGQETSSHNINYFFCLRKLDTKYTLLRNVIHVFIKEKQ